VCLVGNMVTVRSKAAGYDVVVYIDGSGNYVADDRYGNNICRNSRTACIEEAVNYVGSLGGGRVYIRRGTYRISKFIRVLADNVEIYGDGMGRTVIENMDIISPAIYVGNDFQTSIIVRNVYIHDLTIDAKYQYDPNNPKGNGNSTLWAYYVSDLILERIEHKNAYWRTAIVPGSHGCEGKCIQENVVIRQNVFRGVALTLGGIRNLVLEDNIFYGDASSPGYNTILDFSFGEYQDSYIYNATVRGNIFFNTQRHPGASEWYGVLGGFIRVVSATLVGNTFINPDRIAIYIQSSTAQNTTLDVRGLVIEGNTIVGSPDRVFQAIRVEVHKNVIIKGNYIEGAQIGIAVSGYSEGDAEAIIEGNYIRETDSAALYITNAKVVINGNLLYNCARQKDKCIIVDGSSKYSIISNNRLFRDITTYLPTAIDTQYSQGNNLILGNILEGQWGTTKITNNNTDTVGYNVY